MAYLGFTGQEKNYFTVIVGLEVARPIEYMQPCSYGVILVRNCVQLPILLALTSDTYRVHVPL